MNAGFLRVDQLERLLPASSHTLAGHSDLRGLNVKSTLLLPRVCRAAASSLNVLMSSLSVSVTERRNENTHRRR